jgi:predicted ester cyclase
MLSGAMREEEKLAYEMLLHRWFEEVWNQGRENTIDELLAEDFVTHGLSDPAGVAVRGLTSFKPFYRQFRAAFPDIHFFVEDSFVSGDKILARCRITASHTGPGIPPSPTNKRVDFTGMCLVRVQDGKFIEAWNNFDFLLLYQQLGMQLR